MIVLAVDTGTRLSAYSVVNFEDCGVVESKKILNSQVLDLVRNGYYDEVVIEMFSSYGNKSGREVYESIVVIGQIMEACHLLEKKCTRICRKDVKRWICQSINANDGDIRRAIEDRFGSFKGILKADCWQSYALAVAYIDMVKEGKLDAYKVREVELEIQDLRREESPSKRTKRNKVQDKRSDQGAEPTIHND